MSIILSYTSFSAYRSCPLFFRYKYIDRVKPTIPQNNRWFIEGSVVHECLEKGFNHSKPMDRAFVDSIFEETFNKVFAEQSSRGVILFLSGENAEVLKSKSKQLLGLSINVIKKLGMDEGDFYSECPVGTYKEPFELSKDLYIQGSVDWVRVLDNSLIVSDFKTSRDMAYIKAMQLLVYSIALEKKFGKPVDRAFYLMFRSGAQVNVHISDDRRQEAVALLTEVNNDIKSGKFEAKPSNKTCRECVFRNLCKSNKIKYGPSETSFEESLGSKK